MRRIYLYYIIILLVASQADYKMHSREEGVFTTISIHKSDSQHYIACTYRSVLYKNKQKLCRINFDTYEVKFLSC